MIRPAHRLLFILLLAFAVAPPSLAQVATGTPPGGSYSGGPDVLNLGNNNVNLCLPVLRKSGRGTDFSYDLCYDSSIWTPTPSGSTYTWTPNNNFGWYANSAVSSGLTGYSTYYYSQFYCYTNNQISGSDLLESNMVYHDPWGIPHPFSGDIHIQSGTCGSLTENTFNFPQTASDGSGITAKSLGAFVRRDGTAINAPINPAGGDYSASFTDRNGNQISADSSGHFYDTLSSSTPVLTVAGQGTSSSPVTFTYTAPSGASAPYTLSYVYYTVATNFALNGTSEYGATANYLVDKISLPDGSYYQFSYEATPSTPSTGACTPKSGTYANNCVTGRVTKIVLPTGGYIAYSYSGGIGTNASGIFADGSAATLQRKVFDGTNTNTWTYARSQVSGNEWQAKMTDPLGNDTVIYAQEASGSNRNFYEAQRVVYQGSQSGNNVLQTVNTCYNGAASPCISTAVFPPITQRTVIPTLPGSSTTTKHIDNWNSVGLPTESDDYDFGGTTLLRKTLITYAPLGNFINASRQTTTVCSPTGSASACGGTGSVVAQTTNSYDQTTPFTTSNTPQHVTISGSRGNLTTVSQMTSGSNTLNKTFTYLDTGMLNTAVDVNNATTTYVYKDATSTCGNAFPTSINEPLSLSRSMTWNCTGGVQATAVDENNQTTTTTWNDPDFWRPSATADQLNNQTLIGYSTGGTGVSSWLQFNNNSSIVGGGRNFDGLGRPSFDQGYQKPSGTTFDTISYAYDSLGRPYSTSMPCSVSSGVKCPSSPATTTTYDTLGRVQQVTDGGGGTVTYSYNANDVLVTVGPAPSGENTKRRQLEYDALGRLTSVCEITSAAGSASCGQNTAATGYLTKYSYDPLGNLTSVIQNAQSSSTQTRSYSYDSLSRLTSETNPESGTTTYVFDTDSTMCGNGAYTSNGDLVKTIDQAGNCVMIYYDSLHRVTDVGNNHQGASSPCKRFRYDNSAGYPGSTKPSGLAYTLGRLIEAATDTCNGTDTLLTDEWFSYTARGETSDAYQWTPHSGGYYHNAATYWANGVPNLLTGAGGYWAQYNLDGEGRVYSTPSGLNVLTSTTYNAAGQPTQVTFGSNDTDTFTYDPNTGRTTQYKFTVNGSSLVGNLTWNTDGTLASQNIVDPFVSADQQNCNYTHDDLTRLASVSCAGNQIQNSGFESGNVNWTLGGSAWSVVNNSSNAQSGSWYLSGTSNGDQWALNTPNGSSWIPVTPGEVLSYGGWIKRISGTGNLTYGCEVVDANHNFVAWCYAVGSFDTGSGTSWQFYQAQFTVPANGAYVQFYAELHCCGDSDTSSTTGYFDSTFFDGAAVLSQTFAYDPYGNISKSGTFSFQPTYNSSTNRFASVPGVTVSYDANGNVLSDGSHTYSWDTYGKSITVDSVNLTYDALGRMVEQNRSGSYTQIAYSATGFKMAFMNGQSLIKNLMPLPGGAQEEYYASGQECYGHSDHLGSIKLASTPSHTICWSLAYAPFGEPYATYYGVEPTFTGMRQDTVPGLYDFPAREYSTQGRWPTPDPAGLAAADPSNPQSWNRYAYVLNNPLAAIDPLGLDCIYATGEGGVSVAPGDCYGPPDTDNGLYVDGTVTYANIDANGNLQYGFTGESEYGPTLFSGDVAGFGSWDWSSNSGPDQNGTVPVNPLMSQLDAILVGPIGQGADKADKLSTCGAYAVFDEIPVVGKYLGAESPDRVSGKLRLAGKLTSPSPDAKIGGVIPAGYARGTQTATDALGKLGLSELAEAVGGFAAKAGPVVTPAAKWLGIAGWVVTATHMTLSTATCYDHN